jgi:isochorismate synthase
MTSVEVTRAGPAFDLLAAFGENGIFMERAGLGVAGAGEAARERFATAGLAPADAASRAISMIERNGGQGPPAFVFGSVAWDEGRTATFVRPATAVRRDVEGETWRYRSGGAPHLTVRPAPKAPAAPFPETAILADPPPEGYESAVAEAVSRIRAGDLTKVVLARSLVVDAGRPLDPQQLIARLRAVEPSCYTFAFPTDRGRSLVGASPELLVARRGRTVYANPLAGSAPRFGDPAADRASAEELLGSSKDREEHAIVAEAVEEGLAPFCVELERDLEPTVLATANVWHLSTRFSGTLSSPQADALTLALALHPTPAVCGTPREEAASLIRALEPVARGGYAGPVGWVDADGDGVWAIALRCAELDGATARLFAGAGIVADSIPHREFDETERKFRAFLDSLRWG